MSLSLFNDLDGQVTQTGKRNFHTETGIQGVVDGREAPGKVEGAQGRGDESEKRDLSVRDWGSTIWKRLET